MVGKTVCGWPAAAQTVSWRASSTSTSVPIGAGWPTGRDAADRLAGVLADEVRPGHPHLGDAEQQGDRPRCRRGGRRW